MSSEKTNLTIGIDFGGVLSLHDRGADNEGHKSDAIDMPNALETLQKLKSLGHKLILISFCGKGRAIKTKDSVMATCLDVFDRLVFVKNKKFKGEICRKYGCDLMIDDTLELLKDIYKSLGNHCIWFVGDPSTDVSNGCPKNIIQIEDWDDILEKLSSFNKVSKPEDIDVSKLVYDL